MGKKTIIYLITSRSEKVTLHQNLELSESSKCNFDEKPKL